MHPIEVEDNGYALIEFANGAVGSIQASTTCKNLSTNEIEISGTKGSLVITFDGIKFWNVEGLDKPLFQEDPDVFLELLLDFKGAIETGCKPFVSGESGKLATELIHEIYEKAGPPIGRSRD